MIAEVPKVRFSKTNLALRGMIPEINHGTVLVKFSVLKWGSLTP